MAIIVTYDIPQNHVALKNALFQMGYTDKLVSDGKYIYLPNTTLYHYSKSATQAREDVKAIAIRLNTTLERCVATQWGPDWAAIWGQPL